jgi:hypothetical protein
MRLLVKECAKRFPAVPVADLGYDRCDTPLAEAIALLLYIVRDRSRADWIEIPLVYSAFDAVDWPERADQVWHDRARATPCAPSPSTLATVGITRWRGWTGSPRWPRHQT